MIAPAVRRSTGGPDADGAAGIRPFMRRAAS